MTLLWWFVSTALVVLSFVLLVAGLKGREGILRIGQLTDAERQEESGLRISELADVEPVEASNPQPRSVNIPNVVVGIAGILVGVATMLIFAI